MKALLILASIFYSSLSWSISEQGYTTVYQNEVTPYFEQGSSHYLQAFDGIEVHYRHFDRGYKKVILILPGRTEPSSKYAELVFDLKDIPYDVVVMDPRGQGYSERLIPSEPLKGYVKDYMDYVRDVEVLFRELLSRYEEVEFIGHSMGGGIGLLYELTHPGSFKRMSLSSPMIEMKTNGLAEPIAYTLLQGLSWVGRDQAYIPGGSDDTSSGSFETNRVTSSLSRYQMAKELELHEPSLVMASATVGWSLESLKLGRYFFKNRKKVNFPKMLLFQAEHDEFSHGKRQSIFCKEQKNCELIFIKDSKHEMFQERDMIRNQILSRTKQLLSN